MAKAIAVSKEIAITGALIGIATLAPLLHSQLVTGSIINATLIGATLALGARAAVSIALIPSLIALVSGTLPAAMAPMIPYIMMSNIALVAIFMLLRKTNYWFAAFAASVTKFGLLVISANIILGAITHGQISLALASAMGWPQLVTALIGSAIAYVVCERKFNK